MTTRLTSRPADTPRDSLDDLNAIDGLMAEPWLEPPANFTERVLLALPPARTPASSGHRRWADALNAAALLLSSAAGLGALLGCIASLWLATSTAG